MNVSISGCDPLTRMIDKQRVPSPHPDIHLYIVTYWSEGYKIKGYLAEPIWSKTLPGLLYLRGGIKNVGMVRIQRLIQWASEGFVVFGPFYRGNRGGEGNEDFGGQDRLDAVYAVDVLKENKRFDSKQGLHAIGFSRGGVMALWAAIYRKEMKSIISWSGVTDMFLTYRERVDLRRMMKRVIGGTPTKYPERYDFRTPLNQVEDIHASVLIIHGELDEHVSIEHAYQLETLLEQENKHVESWYYETYSHQFPVRQQQVILQEAAKWMKRQ